VNVVADARQEHGPGLGTFAYDDEGVPAQRTPIITNGLFTGYLSSRETAHTIDRDRSGGTLRAEGWNRLPIIRMTNVSILPGETPLTLEQLIASTDHGILMETNRSWSIDDKRYNFQFGCEMGWEIKPRQTRSHAEESIVFGNHDGVLEFDGRDLLARPVDAVGNAQLRQRPAAAGDGHWARGESGEV
jgi:predicted Zn-dependent protease